MAVWYLEEEQRLASELSTARGRAEAEVRALAATLEHKVAERTRELELANAELKAFTGSVSHDLRNHLQVVSGNAEILVDALGDRDAPPGPELRSAQDILKATTRMDLLVHGLLKLARARRAEGRVGRGATFYFTLG